MPIFVSVVLNNNSIKIFYHKYVNKSYNISITQGCFILFSFKLCNMSVLHQRPSDKEKQAHNNNN